MNQLDELFLDPIIVDRYKEVFNDFRDKGMGVNEARALAKKMVVVERIDNSKTFPELKNYVSLYLNPLTKW